MEPFDERVLVELFSKQFSESDVFFWNGKMNIFDDHFFNCPCEKEVSLTITATKDVLYFLFQDLSALCESLYPIWEGYMCVLY